MKIKKELKLRGLYANKRKQKQMSIITIISVSTLIAFVLINIVFIS